MLNAFIVARAYHLCEILLAQNAASSRDIEQRNQLHAASGSKSMAQLSEVSNLFRVPCLYLTSIIRASIAFQRPAAPLLSRAMACLCQRYGTSLGSLKSVAGRLVERCQPERYTRQVWHKSSSLLGMRQQCLKSGLPVWRAVFGIVPAARPIELGDRRPHAKCARSVGGSPVSCASSQLRFSSERPRLEASRYAWPTAHASSHIKAILSMARRDFDAAACSPLHLALRLPYARANFSRRHSSRFRLYYDDGLMILQCAATVWHDLRIRTGYSLRRQ